MEINEKSLGSNEISMKARSVITINNNGFKVYYATFELGNNSTDRSIRIIPGLEDYEETGYNYSDQYICSECNIPKPSARLLDIHVEEVHDSFFKILSQRQPMYKCYVSECDLKFNNPFERRDHCMSKHKYSKNFQMTENRMKSRRRDRPKKLEENSIVFYEQPQSKPQKRKNYEEDLEDFEDYKRTTSDSELDSMTSLLGESRSVLSFIPRQVALKNSYAKILTNNECPNREILENECMMDLAEALP